MPNGKLLWKILLKKKKLKLLMQIWKKLAKEEAEKIGIPVEKLLNIIKILIVKNL